MVAYLSDATRLLVALGIETRLALTFLGLGDEVGDHAASGMPSTRTGRWSNCA